MKFKKLAATVCAAALSLTVMSVTVFAADGIPVDESHFPDENFRAYVSENCDMDKDGRLSDTEIAAADEIYCSALGIKDLKGIEYFTALEELGCDLNQLTKLDLSKNTKLEELDCNFNKLTELDVSKNTALTQLFCNNNQLKELDVSKNTKLKGLYCNSNQLTKLDVSKNTALERLYCGDNLLTELDISNNQDLIIAYRNGHLDDFFSDVGGVFNRTIVIGTDDETGSIIEYTILADEDTKIITDPPQADDDGKIPVGAVAGIAAGGAVVIAIVALVTSKKKNQS